MSIGYVVKSKSRNVEYFSFFGSVVLHSIPCLISRSNRSFRPSGKKETFLDPESKKFKKFVNCYKQIN
jgi:hypothetical protein